MAGNLAAGHRSNLSSPVLLSPSYLHQSIAHFPTDLSRTPFSLLRGRSSVPPNLTVSLVRRGQCPAQPDASGRPCHPRVGAAWPPERSGTPGVAGGGPYRRGERPHRPASPPLSPDAPAREVGEEPDRRAPRVSDPAAGPRRLSGGAFPLHRLPRAKAYFLEAAFDVAPARVRPSHWAGPVAPAAKPRPVRAAAAQIQPIWVKPFSPFSFLYSLSIDYLF